MKMNQMKKQKKIKSVGVRAKLIAVIIPIVLVIIVVFFALSREVIIELSEEKLMADSKIYAGDIYAWKEQIMGELKIYKDTIEEAGFADDAAILEYMKISVDKNSAYPVGLYMGDDTGAYLDASGWVPDGDWVLTERDWYTDGKDNKTFAFGEPYYDSMTGNFCVSASVRMSYPDAVRVLATDVYLDYASELVERVDKDGSRSFLVTKETQTVIAHPDEEMMAATLDSDGIDKLYSGIGKAVSEGKEGLLSLKGDKGSYFVCINEIPDTDWLLVSYRTREDVLSGLHRLELIMVMIAVAAAVVLIVVTLHLMNRVVKPVARVTDVIQKLSDGDFTPNIEMKGTKGNDEIAAMSAHTQQFLVQMRKTIADIIQIARWLEKQSEDNDRVSGSLKDSSRNQAEAMKILDTMVNELSEGTERLAKQMGQMAAVIKEADAEGKSAGEIMRQTVDISENGRKAAEHVSSGMKHIEESISSLSNQIMQTDEAIEQIGSMVEMIVNVADETNLLSLNASIEAARAGEAGKGFAVVADQIGKLAVSSSTAADDISKLTEEIKNAMNQAIEKMEESVSQVKANADLIVENRKTFETVFEKVGEANDTVKQMEELVGRAQTVAASMQEAAQGQVLEAGQITESAHELDGYTKTVNDDSSTVAKNAKELELEAKNLMERVSGFRI